jgi:hypothetical protein
LAVDCKAIVKSSKNMAEEARRKFRFVWARRV